MRTILRANIKRQKGSFIGIVLLIFIISTAIATVLAVWNNSRKYEEQKIEELGYGDITSWVGGLEDYSELESQIGNVEGVERTDSQKLIYCDYTINGKKSSSNGMLLTYEPSEYNYGIFTDDMKNLKYNAEPVKEGCVYITPALRSMFDVDLGDKLVITVGRDETISLTVDGYFEDPFMGSAMMGMKSFIISDADYETISSMTMDNEYLHSGRMIHIFKSANSKITAGMLQQKINDETAIGSCAVFSYQKDNIEGFMLILVNIIAGFLIVFVVVLLIVAGVVIGHNISSSIEQDYVNMGIFKAVGYTGKSLRTLQLWQYFIAIIVGLAAGTPCAVLLTKTVNRIIVSITGLLIPSKLPIGLCMAAYAVITLLLIGFVYIKSRKIEKITPIKAIRQGSDDVFFSSAGTMPVYGKGLNFWLAMRQLVTGKKQYISACIVTVLLVFFVSLVGRIGAWIGPDGEGMMKSFGAAEYTLGVRCEDDSVDNEVREYISSRTDILDEFWMGMSSVTINNIDYTVNVISEPDRYSILKGRTCKYDNEVVLTEFVAKDIGVDIGDTVDVSWGGNTEKYIVSGIYQCANDMGSNFGMNQEGFARIYSTSDRFGLYHNYIIRDTNIKQSICDYLADKFGDSIAVDINSWSGLASIVNAVNALEILMYVIVVIFILVVISLTGSKILYKEQHDLGIYKSLGFSCVRLRITFAIRFMAVALVGSILGIVISIFITDPFTTILLKLCGISSFTSNPGLWQMLWPGIIVVVLFSVFAYIAAGRIKKVSPAILIKE